MFFAKDRFQGGHASFAKTIGEVCWDKETLRNIFFSNKKRETHKVEIFMLPPHYIS